MGSGISGKYELRIYDDSVQVSESFERRYDDNYIESFCREKIETAQIKGSSIDENYLKVKEKYPLRAGGNLGDKGNTSGINVYKSDNPMQSAMEMYSDLSYGGRTVFTKNKHGIQTIFEDESFILFRPYTSTYESPAVEISVVNSKYFRNQKVHFIQIGE